MTPAEIRPAGWSAYNTITDYMYKYITSICFMDVLKINSLSLKLSQGNKISKRNIQVFPLQNHPTLSLYQDIMPNCAY